MRRSIFLIGFLLFAEFGSFVGSISASEWVQERQIPTISGSKERKCTTAGGRTTCVKKPKGRKSPPLPTASPDGEMKRAGEFNGDLRDLPKTKPVRRERPKRVAPKVVPRPYPTPDATEK